jgi:hypothetical protein
MSPTGFDQFDTKSFARDLTPFMKTSVRNEPASGSALKTQEYEPPVNYAAWFRDKYNH